MPLLFPKRVKYRKAQRGKRRGIAKGGIALAFGEFGLRALGNGWVKASQLESARVAITRGLGGGKMWLRVFPDKPVTSHGQEKTMGAGKGLVDHWVAVVKRGRMIVEVDGVPEVLAKEALRLASYKLPLRTRFISRKEELSIS
ncbi:MAG TPA: 50S ribosomal protein L16 [Candidatus Omnitrophica bacterium]|nr:MAG: 50S ribosomal protein L16 [Omnitrophica WOR_2 bacterium GWA2_63_20]OGX16763.1 MAG: 50S ribosomal protein L16 [Omnitrophica WOR_2 bacterium GWF2_63_9]OGX32193.1 MAG: 50S ribosomal protein L16 [Omnitrophica WOR_2 bacterium RIFCSPHIGHO2_12_FULL_64_13]OGX36679.1 MAG: 50S ribosomal protein L16 [Omnitrophica WOR_2 bacterium RIFCSPHIGHO2_02_FULL_63_39]OGX45019.1 MAG: 50S ribosomal protein L16 [Omnitrophica WOR_2 bacterium RIFCSPLOWO2_02_FULL_63_16]OGX49987.1 MAG: 50S ribosomal protein L16 [Om